MDRESESSRNRRKIACRPWLLFVCVSLTAAVARATAPSPATNENAASPRKLNVLILGDSLGLCGFCKRLDENFRKDARFGSSFTYIACGTNPLSWLKNKPYTKVKTPCGFCAIESVPGSEPKKFEDTYGMTRGHSPKAHLVPKLEDLLAKAQPDILVMQTGTNLFGIFSGRKTAQPQRDAPVLKHYLAPFVSNAIKAPSPVRKIYWVSPPTSGRQSKEIQDFLFEQTRADLGAVASVIDSRTLISYPYRHMEPDREHFLGADMDKWADAVFAIIERDVSSADFVSLKPLSETAGATLVSTASTPAESPEPGIVSVKARLVFKSQPMRLEQLLPYQESLVGYVYDVEKLVSGTYNEKQILVMHPAHIGLARQPLSKYRIGKTYKLHLRPLAGTVWETAKSRDDSNLSDLQPYIRVEDESRYPSTAR
jgi:hypothetical protein